jgi:hypothetical protein
MSYHPFAVAFDQLSHTPEGVRRRRRRRRTGRGEPTARPVGGRRSADEPPGTTSGVTP